MVWLSSISLQILALQYSKGAGSTFHPILRTDRWYLKKSCECDVNKQLDLQRQEPILCL